MIFLASFAFAICVHESGHYVAARLLGYPARITVAPKLLAVGVQWGSDTIVSSREDRILVALAGPFASALLAVAAAASGIWMLCLCSALLVLQLIPLGPSDGSHALREWRT